MDTTNTSTQGSATSVTHNLTTEEVTTNTTAGIERDPRVLLDAMGASPDGLFKKLELGKYANPYYRGETKKLRRRSDVVAKRKAQRVARRANRK